MALQRLDKIITDSGYSSRSAAKDFIRSGLVSVNDRIERDPAVKIDAAVSTILVNGQALSNIGHIYIMLNKPEGLLSATEDPRKPTVVDILPEEWKRKGVFPVGRLDKDTTGFLIITDDGDFAHRVISPKSRIPKLYEAVVEGTPTEADKLAFQRGIVLGDGTHCLPAKLFIMQHNLVRVEVFEGKYHQVKRMLGSRMLPVQHLRRLKIGELELDPALHEGEFRLLTEEELGLILPGFLSK